MSQSSTNHAAVSYYLACHDQMLPHFPKPDRNAQPPRRPRPQGNARLYGPGFDFEHDYSDPDHSHDDDWYDYVADVLKRAGRNIHRL
jgi:hypothetical protein